MADDDIMDQKLTITFDDAKTSIDAIRDGMSKTNFPIDGEPEIVKK
jgi:hypothetical protein